ncbi:MAG: single-stranded DNA-binding protein [Candidatus Eiseniibacteriota bacterium]|nr:MAG: single-stranded DNA-binding protein [Candidatus Eisenbacteria bacterium]
MSDVRLVSINKVLLSGRLTRDPELRYTPSGVAVITFSLALNRRYKDQSGEWKEEVSFVNVVAWQRQAELASEFLKKGSAVFVEGRLQSRSWETSEGGKRSVLEVRAERLQFLDRTRREEEPTEGRGASGDDDQGVPF